MRFARTFAFLLAVTVLAGASAVSETPSYANEPSGEFLKSWLICGPFPLTPMPAADSDAEHLTGFEVDFLAEHGGEGGLSVTEGQVEAFEGQSFKWVRCDSGDDVIDLDEAVSIESHKCAYAYCEVESESGGLCTLAVGTNDGGRVWLNGEMVLDRTAGRGVNPDDDLIPVVLRKGLNTLLMKVEERGLSWGFCARFLPFNLEAVTTGEMDTFKVLTDADGQAVLRFMQPDSVRGVLAPEARLRVVWADRPDTEVWSGAWNGEREMAIPVDVEHYGKFRLSVEAKFVGGDELTLGFRFSAGKRIEHVLFDGGSSGYSIVVGADASESERWAASELQHWIKEVGGVELPIKSDADPSSDTEIVLGYNNRSKALLGNEIVAPEPLDESFTYRNVGPAIVIVGGRDRGTMYGVFTFLERELGCRWYTSTVSLTPKKTRHAFDHIYRAEAPGVRVRNDFYHEAFEPIWAARQKVNGVMTLREQPGGVEGYWSVHTFYQFMPPSEFFEEHPEYYSLINGERIHDHAQLCLTNPDVLSTVTERLKRVMREQSGYLIYSVSQNDWRNPCQCDKCQAIVQREGSESGPVIWFVNQVAESIEAEFPDKFVGTLAYQYTRKPCKTLRPRDNVVIRLCSIECCFSHDFLSCSENESFVEDLQGWSAIAPHLYIWDYVVNFSHYIQPYPNFPVLQPNIKAFRDNNAIGIMEQAAYQSRGGEFAELRAYVIAKLLWDPECDVDVVVTDFMYGYYGRSGQHVRRYFDLLHAQVTPERHIRIGLPPDDPLFTDEFVRQAEGIFDDAEAVADSDEILRRVEMARLPLMYLKCLRMPVEAKRDGTHGRFCDTVKREGITHYAEAGVPHREGFHKFVEGAK